MTDPLRQKIAAALQRAPAPTRRQVRLRNALILGAGLAGSLGLFLALGGFRGGGAPRPVALIVGTFGGTLALAVATWRAAWWRQGTMLGPPRDALVGVTLAVPLLYLAWKIGLSQTVDGAADWWPTRVGFRCFGMSNLVSAPILAALLATRRGASPVQPGWAGAALGVAAGATAALGVDLWCPVGHPAHVLMGHALPIALLGALGAASGSRWLRRPAR